MGWICWTNAVGAGVDMVIVMKIVAVVVVVAVVGAVVAVVVGGVSLEH